LIVPANAHIDLQLHTVYSDGHWQPQELMDYLAAHLFRVAAVTDHDTLAHIEELRAIGAARGVHIIAATEITTSWHERPAHLLCYAQRFVGTALADVARTIEQGQRANTRAVYDELVRQGHTFPRAKQTLAEQGSRRSVASSDAEADSDGQVTRPIDNARLLVEHGYIADIRHAMTRIREAGYMQVTAPLAEAVAAAHASGGVAVLAHPGRGGGEIQRYDPDLIEAVLAEVPLDGIEVYYPMHTAAQVAAYEALTRKRGLLVSAGSDSHGPRQRYPIPYEARQCAALLARCGVEIHAEP